MTDKSWSHMVTVVQKHNRKRHNGRNGVPRFTEEEIRAIRRSTKTLKELALEWDRDKRVIGNIRARRTYKEVQ